MKLENLVISPDLANKLRTLGIKQESYFYWEDINGDIRLTEDLHYANKHGFDYCSAFTPSELAELLPIGTQVYLYDRESCLCLAFYQQHVSGRRKTMVDAMATLLIELIEEKLYEIPEVTTSEDVSGL